MSDKEKVDTTSSSFVDNYLESENYSKIISEIKQMVLFLLDEYTNHDNQRFIILESRMSAFLEFINNYDKTINNQFAELENINNIMMGKIMRLENILLRYSDEIKDE